MMCIYNKTSSKLHLRIYKNLLYGPLHSSKVIKETQADMFVDTVVVATREQRIVVVPNPTTADADDDFGFTTTITTHTDSKTYNLQLIVMNNYEHRRQNKRT